MRFDLPYDLWTVFRKPIVFYGLSYRFGLRGPYHHRDQLRRAIEWVLGSPMALLSVRNDGTKDFLETLLQLRHEGIVEIPDPAIYVPVIDGPHHELESDVPNILISLNNEDEAARFGPPSSSRSVIARGARYFARRLRQALSLKIDPSDQKTAFINALAQTIERVIRERSANIILCPHHFHDFRLMGDFAARCPPRLANQVLVASGIPHTRRAREFYDLYAKADAVLSMRVHSMSPAVGLGTPLVALVSDARMSRFLSEAGLTEFAVDIHDPDLAARTYALLTYVLDERADVRRKLRAARQSMREKTRAFNSRVAALLQS
jgi:polysaccharide pyruvyl transferase WcaK-like protein